LQPVVLAERLLQRMKAAIGSGNPLDRSDFRAASLNRKHRAGLYRFAVHVHRASAAMAGVTADVRAGDPEFLAQQVDQQQARLSKGFDIAVVDRQFDMHFGHCSPPCLASARFGAGDSAPYRHPRDMDAKFDWPA
jgi:hypothetical protein